MVVSFAVIGVVGGAGRYAIKPLAVGEKTSRRHRYHKFLLSMPVWLFLGLEGLTNLGRHL